MTFTQRFTEILSKDNSNISNEIFKNMYKDLDIAPSYIDISLERDDVVRFLPRYKMNSVKFTADASVNRLGSGYASLIAEIGLSTENLISHDSDIRLIIEKEFKLIASKLSERHPAHIFHLIEGDNGERAVIYGEKLYQILKPSKDVKYQDIKVGRFIRSFLTASGYKFTDSELEKFVNSFTANIKMYKNMIDDITLVDGDDIKNWYNHRNYLNNKGQLGTSCMRYDESQEFLNIYSENKNKCKLAILRQDGKLIGRALIWTLDNGNLYMDRQYANADNITDIFKEYANRNDMSYFNGYFRGEYDREPVILLKEEQLDNNDISVTLDNFEFDTYPYCDTLRYMVDNKISAKTDKLSYYDLINTNGKRNLRK